MSFLSAPRASIDIFMNNGSTFSCIQVPYVEVDKAVNEYWTCNMKIDYEYLQDQESSGYTIETGNTIDVYMGRDNLYKSFSGKIGPIRREIEGHKPRWTEFEARGWGEILNYTYPWGRTIDTLDNGLKWIVRDLVPGTLTTNHVKASTSTITVDPDGENCFELLEKKCTDNDYIFFIDNGTDGVGDLWAFPLGEHTTVEDLDNKLYRLTYVEDPDNIINYQTVIGAPKRTYGGDNMWTDDPSTDDVIWSTDGSLDKDYSGVKSPDSKVGKGSYVVRTVKSDGSSGIYLEADFRDSSTGGGPLTYDLRRFGTLEFALYYEFLSVGKTDTEITFYVYLKEDDSNYYKIGVTMPGADIRRVPSQPSIFKYRFGWSLVDINFNIRKRNDSDITIVGYPSWENISKLKIEISSPTPAVGTQSILMIDNLQFKNGYYGYTYADSASITQYGRREGKMIYDTTLDSQSECQAVATNIVNNYKDVVKRYESAESMHYLNLLPGYQMVIAQQDDIQSNTITIRRVRHILDELDLRTHLELSDTYIPSIEKIHARFSKDIESLKYDNLEGDITDNALLRFGPVGYDISDIDRTPSKGGNLILNPSFETQDRYYAPEADVPAAWEPSVVPSGADYRSDDQSRDGDMSLFLGDGKTMTSWKFNVTYKLPNDRKRYYLLGFKDRRYNPGSDTGTLKVELVWHEFATLSPKDTITVYAADDDWTTHKTIVDLPNSIMTGILQVVADPGYYYYVDDVWFSELVSTEPAYLDDEDPTQDQVTDTDWNTVKTWTMQPSFNRFYEMNTITFDWKEDPLDSTTHYAKAEIAQNGNIVASNNWSRTPPDSNWQSRTWSPMWKSDWGDSIDVFIAFKTDNGSYPVEYKNLSLYYSSIDVEKVYD